MTTIETEIQEIRQELIDMWDLVYTQLGKTQKSLLDFEPDLAREVTKGEKRVNGYELKIDTHCEHIFALHCPVAVDLRFLLAVLKINYTLERIGDYAESIALYVIDMDQEFNARILKEVELTKMIHNALAMVKTTKEAFLLEDPTKARSVFRQDEILDHIRNKANPVLTAFMKKESAFYKEALFIHSIVQKLERIGDHTTNIAEETVFYIEAKVIKHQKTKNKPYLSNRK